MYEASARPQESTKKGHRCGLGTPSSLWFDYRRLANGLAFTVAVTSRFSAIAGFAAIASVTIRISNACRRRVTAIICLMLALVVTRLVHVVPGNTCS